MRHFFLFIAAAMVLVSGCSSFEVNVTEFPEKEQKTVTLRIYHRVRKGDMDIWEVNYRRVIRKERAHDAAVTLTFYADPYHRGLDKIAYVKADDKKFRVPLRYRRAKMETETVGGIGSAPISSSILDRQERWKKLTGTIMVTEAMEKAVMESKVLQYHVYAGGKATVLQATEAQLERVKEFFTTALPGKEETETEE